MSTFLRFSFFILLITIYSCSASRTEKTEGETADSIAKYNQQLTDSLNLAVKNASTEEEYDIDPNIIPYKIGFNLLNKRNVSISNPFSPDSAFKQLFPGHYYKFPSPYEDGEFIVLEAWSCPSCPPKKYKGWFEETEYWQQFPLKDSNETRLKDVLRFTDDDGNNNVLMSFSTTEFTTDLIPSGRFTCAFLGLALFTEENNKWNLKNFSPALGCYGSFQTAPAINLLKFGKNNYGCYINNTNGGAGGPFYSDSYVFGIVNNQFKLILSKIGTARTNTVESEWRSNVNVIQEEKPFSEIQIVTQGGFFSNARFIASNDDTSNTPIAIKTLIKTEENFDFKIVGHYIFKNGGYELANEVLTTSPAKKEE